MRYVTLILLFIIPQWTEGCGYVLPKAEEVTIGGAHYGYASVNGSRSKRELVPNVDQTEKAGSYVWVPMHIETEYIKDQIDGPKMDAKTYLDLTLMISSTVQYFKQTLKVQTDPKSTSLIIKNFCEQGNRTFPHTEYALLINYTDCTEPNKQNVLATARHCDKSTLGGVTRPTCGMTTICANQFRKRKPNQDHMWIATLKHEIMHALVFSTNLFENFKGAPAGYQANSGSKAIPGVVEDVERQWRTANGLVSHTVSMMVTEKVKEMAQRHFNCSSLEGAEIENQYGEGTAGSHWEKRVFENEAMSGMATQIYAITNITLALFEDSGWYQVNYSMAEPMDWGKDAGCDFVKKSCLDFMLARKGDPWPFCVKPGERCSRDRRSKVLCAQADTDLTKLREDYPDYNYFDPKHEHGPAKPGLELADFCPYYREFSNAMANSDDPVTDTRCTYEENMKPWARDLEVFSETARCFSKSHTTKSVPSGLTKNVTTFTTTNGCYETKCMDNKLWIKTQQSKFYPCHKSGQLIHIHKVKRIDEFDHEEYSFTITCPRCHDVCSQCVASEPPEYVGDKVLNGKIRLATVISLLFSLFLAALSL